MTPPRVNALGQPIGAPLAGTFPVPRVGSAPMAGRFVRLERAKPEAHAADLFDAYAKDRDGRMWTYLPYGPFETGEALTAWMETTCTASDPMFFALLDADRGRAIGLASYLRINPDAGSVEVGHLSFSPLLARSPLATEAMFLMMRHAFELGYRRYEWKCDALNAASCRAAERLGFTFEGIHRQATHYKGRNRDTAWYSILDREWTAVQAGFDAWLDPANFDAAGTQRRRLEACRTGGGRSGPGGRA